MVGPGMPPAFSPGMSRSLASLALVSVLATQVGGCAHNTQTRVGSVMMIAGGAVVAGGASMASEGNRELASNRWLDGNPNNDVNGLGESIDGTLLLVAGLVLLAAGGVVLATGALADEPPAFAPAPMPEPAPAPVATAPAIVTPAEVASNDELPMLPTSPRALQLAVQVRALVRHGQCDAAQQTLGALELQDLAYARAVASGGLMAPCAR